MKATGQAFWRCYLTKLFLNSLFILRKLFIRERGLGEVPPAKLLEPLFVMGNSWKVSKNLIKTVFSTRNTTEQFFQKFKNDTVASVVVL